MGRSIPILALCLAACGGREPLDPGSSEIDVIEGVANVDGYVVLQAVLRDAEGRPLAGLPVQWDTSGSENSITSLRLYTDPSGLATALMHTDKPEVKRIAVRADNTSVFRELEFAAGRPAWNTTLVIGNPAPADGASAVQVELHVRDQFGNAVPHSPVQLLIQGTGATLEVQSADPARADALGVFKAAVRSLVAQKVRVAARTGTFTVIRDAEFF